MATTTAKTAVVAVVVMASLMAPGHASAEPGEVATVVLHVADYQHVPARELADAQKKAARPYGNIGIRLVWTDGNAREATGGGALHVVILNAHMTEAKNQDPGTFGQASPRTKRAYIYYPRLVAHAMRTNGDPATTLALVLAHEIGHLLLPEYSHAPSGLMRAHWEGRVDNIPSFIPAQATTIRMMLASAN